MSFIQSIVARRNPARASRYIRPILLAAFVQAALLLPASTDAQESNGTSALDFPTDSAVVSQHVVDIGGVAVPYTAEVGYQPVWNEDGVVVASLFYTYYQRSDVQDRDSRPLMVSFNGGPGSGSLWMHIGYTGPRMLRIDDEGYPVMPYGMADNPNSILDATDIVYVNPVNVGYSRMVGEQDRSMFFGVNEDVRYLSDWIRTFVTRHERWPSPKYLIGESYGTTRASGLARELQGSEWMYLNGVVLVSPTGLGVDRAGPVRDALYLPNYTATAWYHGRLEPSLQERDLDDVLAEVEVWTLDTYLPALARAGSLEPSARQRIAQEAARWAGVSADWYLNHNLRPSVGEFRKELLRQDGYTVGRLDARYKGRDRENAGDSYDYDPALSAWNQAFSPAINHYYRTELGWTTDLQYYLFGPVRPWNRDGDQTGESLRQAMAENPYLHLFVQSGYYDGGTDYFSAKYTMWNLDPAGLLQERMRFAGYRSGHMMYLRADDRITSNQDIRDFIQWAQSAAEGSAGYDIPDRD